MTSDERVALAKRIAAAILAVPDGQSANWLLPTKAAPWPAVEHIYDRLSEDEIAVRVLRVLEKECPLQLVRFEVEEIEIMPDDESGLPTLSSLRGIMKTQEPNADWD